MLQIILVPLIFLSLLGLFAFALRFSKYKQHGRGSCGSVDCCQNDINKPHNHHSCYSSKLHYLENEVPRLKQTK